MKPAAHCPICKREIPAGDGVRPFCSERCRLVDLGGWLDGRYRIGSTAEEDEDGAAPEGDMADRRGDS